MQQSNKLAAAGLLLAGALFLIVNLFSGDVLRSVRADLTEQKLYTLSEGTRNILGDLEEPITLRYFYPESMMLEEERLKPLMAYGERVREMLDQYVAASDGQVRLEVIDPEPLSEAEELAVAYGIQGVTVNMQGDRMYFGLAGTNSVDDEEVIGSFDPTREHKLEFDITELIDRLEDPEQKVLGLVSALPLRGGTQEVPNQFGQPQTRETEPWPIVQLLDQSFDVRDLDPATLTEVPADVDILMLVHPKGLSPEGVYAIDQFALAGGKVAAFVDSYAFYDPTVQGGGVAALDQGQDTGIDPLLEAWGVRVRPSASAGDETTAYQIGSRSGAAVRLPLFFEIRDETIDDDDIVTASLETAAMMSPAVVEPADDLPDGLEVTSLMTTTAEGGGTLDPMLYATRLDPEQVLELFAPGGEALSLAVRVRGSVRTAFEEGPPSAENDASADDDQGSGADDPAGEATEGADGEAGDADPDHLTESKAPFNAIVVGDTDMLHAELWANQVRGLFGGLTYRARNGNAPFMLGILESLSGSDDLISLRSREPYARPFTRKEDLRRAAEEEFREKEQELEQKLQETEARLQELQSQKSPTDALLLSPEQEAELARFQEERLETRRELRRVRRELDADIDALGTRLELLNVFVLPLVIALLAAAWFLARRSGGARA